MVATNLVLFFTSRIHPVIDTRSSTTHPYDRVCEGDAMGTEAAS